MSDYTFYTVIGIVFLLFTFSSLGVYVAEQKGRNVGEGAFFGFFLGILGVFLVALLPNEERKFKKIQPNTVNSSPAKKSGAKNDLPVILAIILFLIGGLLFAQDTIRVKAPTGSKWYSAYVGSPAADYTKSQDEYRRYEHLYKKPPKNDTIYVKVVNMNKFDLRKFLVENRTAPTSVKEMASFGKMEGHEDYQFMIRQLEGLIKDEQVLAQVKRIVEAVGELGLDLGYAEAKNDNL